MNKLFAIFTVSLALFATACGGGSDNSGNQEAEQARPKDNGYIPPDMVDRVRAHTEIVAGGNTSEVTFTAPGRSVITN